MQPVIVVARERGIWFGWTDDLDARPLVLQRARTLAKEMSPLVGRPTIEITQPIRQIIEVDDVAVKGLDYNGQ